MKVKLFPNRQIINDYSSITYVGTPTYLLKSGAVSDRCGIFANREYYFPLDIAPEMLTVGAREGALNL